MAKYPVRNVMPKPKPAPTNRAAPPITQKGLDRAARMQSEESISEGLLMKRGKPDVIRTTVNMRTTPAKKGR